MAHPPILRIEQRGYAGWLVALDQAKSDGVLTVTADGVETQIAFQGGAIVGARGGVSADALGAVLQGSKALSREGVEAVLAARDADPDGGRRFGELARALALVTREQVEQALAAQRRRKAARGFAWADPVCKFVESVVPVEADVEPIAVPPIVIEGVRRFYSPDRVDVVLGPYRALYPKLPDSPDGPDGVVRRFGLRSGEAHFVATLDGRRTTDAALAASALDSVHAAQIFCALVLAGAIELDVRRAVNSSALRAAWTETVPVTRRPPAAVTALTGQPPASSPSPGPTASRPAGPASSRGESGDSRAPPGAPGSTPLRALEDAPPSDSRGSLAPSSGRSPDAGDRRVRADELFRAGRDAMRRGETPMALAKLREAADLRPERKELRLHALWAELACTETRRERDALRTRLDALVRAIVVEDRNLGFAHFVKGHLNLMAGDEAGALKCFRLALRIDPDDVESQRQVRLLQRRLEGR